MKPFWEKRDEWLPTWNQDSMDPLSNSLRVDYIRVYELDEPMSFPDDEDDDDSLVRNLLISS